MRAMVLAAGRGTRLGTLTDAVPKPMLDVQGRPIVEWVVRHLVSHGFAHLGLNLHYRGDLIRTHLGDGKDFGAQEIHYFDEPELLGTGGAVKRAGDYLAQEGPFLVQYGDVVTDQDVRAVMSMHVRRGATASIVVHERPGSNSVAVIGAEGRVERFLERPTPERRRGATSNWAFSGICVLEPKVIELLPAGFSDLPADLFPRLADLGELGAIPLDGRRVAVDSPERLERLRAEIAAGQLAVGEPTTR